MHSHAVSRVEETILQANEKNSRSSIEKRSSRFPAIPDSSRINRQHRCSEAHDGQALEETIPIN
jgi:hypothetical protein